MKNLLQQYFGFSEFRKGQEPVISALLNGQSAAAIFPTGSGKSLCYQLPALQLPHLTLVVSPLLALIQDQLDFLRKKGIAAASIQSMQSAAESSAVYKAVADGEIKILFISVERLNSERFRQFLKQVPISLLVVDEAHCISEWGHNFRPDYLKLAFYRQEFNIQQVLLLTATATTQVIEDMASKFSIDKQNITVTGSYRSNLNLSVVGTTEANKMGHLVPWLEPKKQSAGIVYVTLQQTTERVAKALTSAGIYAQAYHAGMPSEQRTDIQQRFMSGELQLIVATIAFGMGIDKSDIRFVVHYDLPKSIENYAQEIGRAGRDGQSAECLVLANKDNLNVLENFVYSDTPEPSAIDYIINEVVNSGGNWEVLMNSLSSLSNIRLLALKTLLVYLELEDVLKPAYSYYAEYKYKLLVPETELLGRFKEERYHFVQAVLQSSDKARTWASVNFDKLQNFYPSDRSRVVSALDYLDQQGLMELQTKQMTNVYKTFQERISPDLAGKLAQRFSDKEQSEITRIHFLLDFFASKSCLNWQLAYYFSDANLQQPCGHCSVCAGAITTFPEREGLMPLVDYDFVQLTGQISDKLGKHKSDALLARFLCGLTTPIFTRLKVRQLPGFATLEKYRFGEVLHWVQENGTSVS
ncbi:RecQ family ATP-dependent DNA helicase [Psychromonas sp. Urea-02u-13]|uniref:RecQ family ATP-dependent DNA helicase n=1 Tax=Psychromonas sp. Urea-02u-13 TaxID=2058326 RepID=UPI000C31F5E2|nr:RecQ family ATP-dependent DNA helicase [Psychromonas sp. Urea-02u-13]PKG40536.1 recombinase RecQ [Psychromonas sp. Urea-02u-13]